MKRQRAPTNLVGALCQPWRAKGGGYEIRTRLLPRFDLRRCSESGQTGTGSMPLDAGGCRLMPPRADMTAQMIMKSSAELGARRPGLSSHTVGVWRTAACPAQDARSPARRVLGGAVPVGLAGYERQLDEHAQRVTPGPLGASRCPIGTGLGAGPPHRAQRTGARRGHVSPAVFAWSSRWNGSRLHGAPVDCPGRGAPHVGILVAARVITPPPRGCVHPRRCTQGRAVLRPLPRGPGVGPDAAVPPSCPTTAPRGR